jgi:hypothetical protein
MISACFETRKTAPVSSLSGSAKHWTPPLVFPIAPSASSTGASSEQVQKPALHPWGARIDSLRRLWRHLAYGVLDVNDRP